MRRPATLGISLAISLCISSPAFAQKPDREVRAEELFREAKLLIDQRRYDEACPKLAESQRLDPAGGTALTLALCHQAGGRLATATLAFAVALEFAERDKRADRAKVARAAVAKLTPLLSKLVVRVDAESAALPDLRVERDGELVAPSAFDVPVPVDGGPHTVVASAPGHRPVELAVTVAPQEELRTVEVPRLEPLAPAEPPAVVAPPKPAARRPAPDARTPPEGTSSTRLVMTVASFGLALAGGATATYFGLRARADDDEADGLCPASPCSDKAGVVLNQDARREAWIATAAAGIGVAGALTGAVLLLTRPRTAPPGQAAWSITPSGKGASIQGVF